MAARDDAWRPTGASEKTGAITSCPPRARGRERPAAHGRQPRQPHGMDFSDGMLRAAYRAGAPAFGAIETATLEFTIDLAETEGFEPSIGLYKPITV